MRLCSLIYVAGFFFLLACNPTTDKQAKIARAPTNKSIETVPDIQREYTEVAGKMRKRMLDSASFKYDCYGEKSGTVTYFSEKGTLKVIEHRYSEYSHFNAADIYYVKDGRLFFAFLKSMTWAFEDGPEGATKDNIKERRVYVVHGQAVKCLEKDFVIHSTAKNKVRADEVPNKSVDCASAEKVLTSFGSLLKLQNKPAPECLEL